jgi:hypothetical protein
MRPITKSISGLGSTDPIQLDHYRGPFNVGLGVVLAPGSSLTYTVEHTFNDVNGKTFNPALATWFANGSLTSQTASKDGNYAFPVMAIRLTVTSYTSGSVSITAIQAGMAGE